MPITISHLKRNTRTIAVDFMGEQVNITYKPGEMTPALSLEMADVETRLPIVTVLERTVTAWDVMDDDMRPLPITRATLLELPSAFLAAVFDALMEDVSVGKPSGATSGAG